MGVRVLGEGSPEESSPSAQSPSDQSPSDAAEVTASGTMRSGPPRAVQRIVVSVAVLGLIGTAVFALKWNGLRHQHDAQRQAEAVARQFLIALTNFDGTTVDADFGRILSYAADNSDFAKQAQSTFSSDLARALKAKQASTRGEVHFIFVQSVSGNSADVYAVVDLTTFNNSLKSPVADELRVDVTLQRAKGLWRVSELTVLQAPPVANSPLTGSTPTTVGGG